LSEKLGVPATDRFVVAIETRGTIVSNETVPPMAVQWGCSSVAILIGYNCRSLGYQLSEWNSDFHSWSSFS
jgi:hypothetical protein